MKTSMLRSLAAFVGMGVLGIALAMTTVLGRLQSTSPPKSASEKPKTLRELVVLGDVERSVREGPSTSEYNDVQSLVRASTAIVMGTVLSEESYFSTDNEITTVYSVDVRRVLKDETLQAAQLSQALNKMLPAPLAPKVTFTRFGGTVMLNGHRASMMMKGRGEIKPGKPHVFFLEWTGKNYHLVGGMSGVFFVSNKSFLEPLGVAPTLYERYAGKGLETLLEDIKALSSN